MGINHAGSGEKKQQFVNFTSDNWELQPQTTRRVEYGQYNTYKHKLTNQQIDKYTLGFHSQVEQRNYYECFLERLREDYVVNTVYYETKTQKQLCSTTHQGDAYIQHIPVRLCDITDIPFEQFLYMLKLSLLGFQKLYHNVGYFEVKEDLVCIDKQGRVRVWMNCDLSKNYPEGYEKDGEGSRDSQRLMVGEIISLIQRNTEDSQGLHVNISLYFQRNGIKYPTFKEALDLIESYVNQFKVIVPKYCQSVIQIFRDDYGAQFNVSEDEEIFYGQNRESERISHGNVLDENILNGRPSDNAFQNNQSRRNANSYRPSQSQPYNFQRSAEQSESRGFMLSEIKENTDENIQNQFKSPSAQSQNHFEPIHSRKPSEKMNYYANGQQISPPRITFSYNGTNFQYYGNGESAGREPLKYSPLNYNTTHMYHSPPPIRISEKSEISSYQSQHKYLNQGLSQNYLQSRNKSIHYDTPDSFIELDTQIYNDMLKYL